MSFLQKKYAPHWVKSLILLFFISSHSIAASDPIVGEKKALVCSACHGSKGISINPEWPHLAGQHAIYFIKQLRDFKQGARQGTVMGPLVANLTEEDMRDIAAYYAQLPDLPTSTTPGKSLSRGEVLYRQGELQHHITACITCHGPDGKGNAEAGFPLLRGQSMLYTIQQLQSFKSGQRKNDLNGIMHDISSHLNNEDIQALATYIAEMDVKHAPCH